MGSVGIFFAVVFAAVVMVTLAAVKSVKRNDSPKYGEHNRE
ncbi:hypothetical protein [uncultured Paenibacillus sp.]|nr:hypothetical protein [uncultured Paenibacillus sp.]